MLDNTGRMSEDSYLGIRLNVVFDYPGSDFGRVDMDPEVIEGLVDQVWPLLDEDEQALKITSMGMRARIGEVRRESEDAEGDGGRTEELDEHFEQWMCR